MQNKVSTSKNPFLDRDYTETRTHEREKQNVSGPYRAIWNRQDGKCYYCGRPILPDQPRTTTTIDLSRPPSIKNSAYIHKICALNELEVIRSDKDVSYLRPFDIMSILEEIADRPEQPQKEKPPIGDKWKYHKLKEYFAKCKSASVTLTFKEIEKISGVKTPPEARTHKQWWYPRKDYNRIAEAWITEGYFMKKLNLEAGRITFHRDKDNFSKLEIPEVITEGRLPDDAIYEIDTFMEYIIEKYALR